MEMKKELQELLNLVNEFRIRHNTGTLTLSVYDDGEALACAWNREGTDWLVDIICDYNGGI
jgi:hypothetical protein